MSCLVKPVHFVEKSGEGVKNPKIQWTSYIEAPLPTRFRNMNEKRGEIRAPIGIDSEAQGEKEIR